HRRAWSRYRLVAAGRRALRHHGRHHRGRDRPYFWRVPRADRRRAQGLDRRAHHADERLHVRVSRGALGDHAGGRRRPGHGDFDHRHRHLPDSNPRPGDPWIGQCDLGAGVRAGSARLGQGWLPHHHRARAAEHPFGPDRAGDDPVRARDPGRGGAVLPRARHAAAAAVLGAHAERCADVAVPVADARGLSGRGDRCRRAWPQSARRRVARSARSTAGAGALNMSGSANAPLIEVKDLGCRLNTSRGAAQARKEAIALLDRVGLPDAAKRVDAYPHQFSGGQRQRVTIAMALACQPDVLIADEPTTALDVTIQGQILDLIADLVAERGMSMILISHDLGVIAENVQRMMVMYGGAVVESGATDAVFTRMGHPYTQGLFRARPRLGARKGTRLKTIAGTVPELADLPSGCTFADRCAIVEDCCRVALPAAVDVGAGHGVRCLRTDVSMAEAAGVLGA